MSDPVTFDSISPRYALPLLYAGQAQKEIFVNEAVSRADALLHCAIEGESPTPPASPSNGDTWLVAAGASGAWAGQDGLLTCQQSGNWLFIAPRDGMRVLDRSNGQEALYFGGWQRAAVPLEPIGGSTVDDEARSAIVSLIAALRATGVLPMA